MLKYFFNRMIISIATILILVTIVFILVRIIPGDPFQDEKMTPEIKANMMAYYGFDKPIYIQYGKYISNLLKGDLGVSLKTNRPIVKIIRDTFPYSADLGIRALVFALAAGLLLGINSSLHAGKAWDYICIIIAVIGVSIPDFITGSLVQYAFAVKLKLFPVALWKGFKYTILPTLTLGLYPLSLIARNMRTSMMEVIHQDYIMTAEAKGLSPFQIVWNHQIRNAIIPVVTLLGPLTASILTGTFVVEMIFAVPGMGRYYVTGLTELDYSMILGMTVFYGCFLVLANFVVDMLYGLIDPRIRILGK